jgi:hypothetical protein
MLQQVFEASGLVGSVFFSGPEPGQGGNWINIRYVQSLVRVQKLTSTKFSVHSGKTRMGSEFSKLYPAAIESLKRAQNDFAAKVYSELRLPVYNP